MKAELKLLNSVIYSFSLFSLFLIFILNITVIKTVRVEIILLNYFSEIIIPISSKFSIRRWPSLSFTLLLPNRTSAL